MFDISMTYFESGQEQNPIFTFFIKLQIIYIQTLDVLSHTKISYDLRVCHDLIQGQFGKFKVTKRKSADFVSGLYLSYWETLDALTLHRDCLRPEGVLWFRFKVICASSSSLEEKVQDLWSVYYIFLFMEYHRCSYFTQRLCMTCGCVMIMTQGHLAVTKCKITNLCCHHMFELNRSR